MGNQFKNMAVIICLKTSLFICNLVLWLTGTLLLSLGICAESDLHKYLELSSEFSGTAAYVVIGVAGLVVLISSAAFSSVIKCQTPIFFFVYGGFMSCVFMMEVGVGASVACYRDTFPRGLRDGLTSTISSHDSEEANIDFAQKNLQCCGASNYTDWIRLSAQKVIPASCCIDPKNCVTANYNDVFQKGCYDVISEHLARHMDLLISIAIGTAALPLVAAILSCLLAGYIKKSKYDAVN